MIGGDSKFVLTCIHTRVPAHTHTHNTYLEIKKNEIDTRQMGVGIRKKKRHYTLRKYLVVIFPSVDSLATPLGT